MQRLAVYGGTFDPFHLGHLVPTIRAQETFRFDAVVFVPARTPPHKPGQRLPSATHRLVMVAMATLPYERFFASQEEVFTEGPNYTVDTVRRFRKRYPDQILYFLLGSDSFSQISTWEGWQELTELAHLVVLHRPHMWGEELRSHLPVELLPRLQVVAPFERVPDPSDRTIYLLEHEPFPISATSIRDRQRQGRPIRELVPHEVHSYIEKYRLYQHDAETQSSGEEVGEHHADT